MSNNVQSWRSRVYMGCLWKESSWWTWSWMGLEVSVYLIQKGVPSFSRVSSWLQKGYIGRELPVCTAPSWTWTTESFVLKRAVSYDAGAITVMLSGRASRGSCSTRDQQKGLCVISPCKGWPRAGLCYSSIIDDTGIMSFSPSRGHIKQRAQNIVPVLLSAPHGYRVLTM